MRPRRPSSPLPKRMTSPRSTPFSGRTVRPSSLQAIPNRTPKSGLSSPGWIESVIGQLRERFHYVLIEAVTEELQTPELFAVLTEHFGEPGRHSAAVDEIMRGTSSGGELRRKLISENYIYLEDSSPSARVRAFEWLRAQKLAPAGFDPLGSPKQRRQALDQALSAGGAQ